MVQPDDEQANRADFSADSAGVKAGRLKLTDGVLEARIRVNAAKGMFPGVAVPRSHARYDREWGPAIAGRICWILRVCVVADSIPRCSVTVHLL
jgi:hypothetical protein